MNTIIVRITTVIAYAVMIIVNYLAVTLPIAGRDTGAISDSYPNLFAPAGYAFSIWGVIYTLLGIYVVYQLGKGKDELVGRVNRIFIVNALLNASWILAWHYDFIGLSVIIMGGLLYTLIAMSDILKGSDKKKVNWIMRLPFSVYFGWITVATIANITVFLVYLGWDGFGLAESFWTVAILLIGAIIGSWRMLIDRNIPYGIVLLWAYGAILSKHTSESGFAGQYQNVIATVIICLLLFGFFIVKIIYKNKK